MKKGDFIWGAALLVWIIILAVPATRTAFMAITDAHPYAGGFVKFAILATMGDFLGTRIRTGNYINPQGLICRAFVWGVIGLMVTLVFPVYMGGTSAAQASGRLPFNGSALAQAFFASTIMNVTFGPMLMAFHKFTDLYLDTAYEKNSTKVSIRELVSNLDWHTLVEFSWLKTCSFFWIPAHTIVFLLPPQYRVLASAFLSIALGLLMAIAKKEKTAKTTHVA